jgi:hypothetical protein
MRCAMVSTCSRAVGGGCSGVGCAGEDESLLDCGPSAVATAPREDSTVGAAPCTCWSRTSTQWRRRALPKPVLQMCKRRLTDVAALSSPPRWSAAQGIEVGRLEFGLHPSFRRQVWDGGKRRCLALSSVGLWRGRSRVGLSLVANIASPFPSDTHSYASIGRSRPRVAATERSLQ